MHFYEFNIKSYHAATAHLSDEEDLAYRRLIDYYYDTELPIPTALPPLCRRLRVALPTLETVLNEFFFLQDNGWHNAYCDEKIAQYRAYIARQKNNGSKGGRGNKADAKSEKPTALPKSSGGLQPLTTKPLTTKPIEKQKSAFALPDWFPQSKLDEFKAHRKAIRKPMSERAVDLLVGELVKLRDAGHDPIACLDEAILQGWQKPYPPKNKQHTNAPAGKFDPVRYVNDKEYAAQWDAKKGGANGRVIDIN